MFLKGEDPRRGYINAVFVNVSVCVHYAENSGKLAAICVDVAVILRRLSTFFPNTTQLVFAASADHFDLVYRLL